MSKLYFIPKRKKEQILHICLPTMGIFIYKKNSIVIIHSFVTKKCLSGQNGKLILLHFSMYFLIHLLYCTCMYLFMFYFNCLYCAKNVWLDKMLLLFILFYFFALAIVLKYVLLSCLFIYLCIIIVFRLLLV